ncbi:MAG: TlpA family protein disulfide reductase [Deltaproteobacteria bacterium]|nr:TlpA family protein disulfide reductase [Deltaproteobacteria bacterium]
MTMRRAGVVALVCATLMGGTASWAQEKKSMTPLDIPMIGDIQMRKVGDTAPDFALTDLDGKPFDLKKNGSQRVNLLVFWSIFCEPCKAEMPLIQRLYDQYKGKGFDVLAVAMDGEPMKKSIQGLVRQQGYTFRVFIDKLAADESFVVADPYGVAGTPTLYLVDRAGKITLAEVGQTSREVLEKAIQKALEAK